MLKSTKILRNYLLHPINIHTQFYGSITKTIIHYFNNKINSCNLHDTIIFIFILVFLIIDMV